MNFTAQTKEGPKKTVHLNVKEIERLLEFAKNSKSHYVSVTGSETGIGMHLKAHDLNGVTQDITDYDCW